MWRRFAHGCGDALDLLASPARQRATLGSREHRPWPLPPGPWLMAQTWTDLLFAHWRLEPRALAPHLPAGLALDTFEGQAWLGVTPFLVRHMRLRLTPPLPVLSTFPELNVRTYVRFGDRPGIWFFSLDAARAAAVLGARLTFKLPYLRARMSLRREGAIDYTSVRAGSARADGRLHARYRPLGEPFRPVPGTLEHWLTERYRLYTVDRRGRLGSADIHHPPWSLQRAEADLIENSMAGELGVELAGEPLLHFAARQDVLTWPLRFCTS
jgi:uncharacterized protein YqjF (DUF2071 family)